MMTAATWWARALWPSVLRGGAPMISLNPVYQSVPDDKEVSTWPDQKLNPRLGFSSVVPRSVLLWGSLFIFYYTPGLSCDTWDL